MKGYVSISIPKNLIDRVDKLFEHAGFTTRSGYIQSRLRRAIERDETKYQGGTGDGNDDTQAGCLQGRYCDEHC